MQAVFKVLASYVALGCNAGAVVILGVAAIEAVVLLIFAAPRWADQHVKRRIWVRFASSIVLSLEFALAADIVETAITPSWDDIGRLAAIATIRTGLNFFLSRDIESVSRSELANLPAAPSTPA